MKLKETNKFKSAIKNKDDFLFPPTKICGMMISSDPSKRCIESMSRLINNDYKKSQKELKTLDEGIVKVSGRHLNN